MKYLKRYSQLNESRESIEEICQEWGIYNYSINGDGKVDVIGDVNLRLQRLSQIPIQFGKVSGNFDCSKNNLTTLEGAPMEVGGDFDCHFNRLDSLTGGPSKVGAFYNCSMNRLTNLVGSPLEIKNSFFCQNNQLTSLVGSPLSVSENFNIVDNYVTSIVGCPEIGGFFYCSQNPVVVIINFFYPKLSLFIEKVNYLYPDLWIGRSGSTLQGDILEQIAEELGIQLPPNWIEKVRSHYKVVGLD